LGYCVFSEFRFLGGTSQPIESQVEGFLAFGWLDRLAEYHEASVNAEANGVHHYESFELFKLSLLSHTPGQCCHFRVG
jgi:hypothetical protein